MKKLPIGISTFRKIREEGHYYVDKTSFVASLVREGAFYFLSRPRRFGKSLFLDTLAEAFAGNCDLFKGLYLEKNWDWGKKYPVVRISFGGGVIKDRTDLEGKLDFILNELGKDLGFAYTYVNSRDRFTELLKGLPEIYGLNCVVLVDEYDKPILDNITDLTTAIEIREGLKNFYSVIKDSDAHVKFCFLTGVSKFSKVSLFSGLNNLKDITLDSRYGTICGYTQADLESVFAERLGGVDLDQVKTWYNGYNFLGEPVYNPFDVLLFLDSGEYKNYWFETGTPEFLVKMLIAKKIHLPGIENLVAGDELLGSFDVDHIEPETLLFQTGYLTIKSFRQHGGFRSYELTYPNLEVRASVTGAFLNGLVEAPAEKAKNQGRVFDALDAGNLDSLRDIFHAFFASIPHDWYRKNELAGYEGYWASIFYCYLTALGIDTAAEDTTNKGRVDMTARLGNRVFVFEFKVIEMTLPGGALEQLRSKGYHEKFMGRGLEIYLVGVEFSKVGRNIAGFGWERVE